jgi:hypothetical protein
MKGIDDIRRRLNDIEDLANVGAIPTSDNDGNRAWIRGRGCGIRFMFEIIKARHDGTAFTEDQQEQLDLWSRAEVDSREKYGDLARANREMARDLLGLPHGAHL